MQRLATIRPATGQATSTPNYYECCMDRTSTDDTAKTTKGRLLDAAQQLYTKAGHEGLSLRDLTELAGVNLAAVNYHFGSKTALVCAMVSRRFDPINETCLRELSRLEDQLQDKLRCEHVFAALLKSVCHPRFNVIDSPQQWQFAIRSSCDLSQPLRQFLTQRYGHVEQRFIDAFCRVTPWLSREEVDWRIRCVAFSLPGISLNTSTYEMLRAAIDKRLMTPTQALVELTGTARMLLSAPALDAAGLDMLHAVFTDPMPEPA